MVYKIKYLKNVVKKDIPQLPKKIKAIIRSAIENKLAVDPISFGKPLRNSFSGHRRMRVGDYRIVCRIEKENDSLTIVFIRHRKDVYKD